MPTLSLGQTISHMRRCLPPSCLAPGAGPDTTALCPLIPMTLLCSPFCEQSQAIKSKCSQWCSSACQGTSQLWITKSAGSSAQTCNRMICSTKLSKLWQWLDDLTRPCLSIICPTHRQLLAFPWRFWRPGQLHESHGQRKVQYSTG